MEITSARDAQQLHNENRKPRAAKAEPERRDARAPIRLGCAALTAPA
jgi:hypothetical protein